jgi:DMSO reductase anchor subunit
VEFLKYYINPSENKLISTLILFCVYLVYSTFVLSLAKNAFSPLLLFILYLFGGPAALIYINTVENSTNFVAVILVFLALYQYLVVCTIALLIDRFSKKKEIIKTRKFNI